MKRREESVVTAESIGGGEDISFSIDKEDMHKAYDAFTQYSDAIGSIVREITSNCFDSHKQAGVDRPVTIKINRSHTLEGDTDNIEFIDYGTGLTPEDVRTVFAKFFKSTKEHTNDQIGMFGIGAKSPLAYTDLFEVDTFVDGTEYNYLVASSADGPVIKPVDQGSTDRTNGTIVRVPIKSGDRYKFKDAIKKQLAYFDNIEYVNIDINEDLTTYKGNHFVYREDSPFSKIHVCFGKVYYALDYDQLDWAQSYTDRNKYNVPIGLHFDIGDIDVVWNREQIKYTEHTIQSIKDKFSKVQEEFQTLYDSQFDNITTCEEWVKTLFNNSNKNVTVSIGDDKSIDIPYTKKLISEATPKWKKWSDKFPKLPKNPFGYLLRTHRKVREGSIHERNTYHLPDPKRLVESQLSTTKLTDIPTYYVEDQYGSRKNRYIYNKLIDKRDFYLVKSKLIGDSNDSVDDRLKTMFGFDNPAKNNAGVITDQDRKNLLQFESELLEFFKGIFRDYSDVKVTDEYIEWENEQRRKEREQKKKREKEIIPVKIIEVNDSWDGSYKWMMDKVKLKNLNPNGLYVYGFQDDDDKLLNFCTLMYAQKYHRKVSGSGNKIGKSYVNYLKIGMNREKHFKDFPNAYHIDDFLASDHPIIRRCVNAIYVKDELNKFADGNGLNDKLSHAIDPKYNKYNSQLTNIQKYETKLESRVIKWLKNNKMHLVNKSHWDYKIDYVCGFQHSYKLLKWITYSSYSGPKLQEVLDELSCYISEKENINPALMNRLYKYKNFSNDE